MRARFETTLRGIAADLTTTRVRSLAIAGALALALLVPVAGCSSSGGGAVGAGCAPGTTVQCSCPNQMLGVSMCNAQGFFDPCSCAPVGDVVGGADVKFADLGTGPGPDTAVCTPSCAGKVCGSDGCGGICGSCPAAQSCDAAGQCVGGCTPSCGGKVCGSDGCGGSCGTCGAGESCDGTGQCTSGCTADCNGKVCGDDGCGSTCGSCTGGQTCNASGQCVGGCIPNCSGKACGDDGCGSTCGSCSGGQTCNNSGQCIGGCIPNCSGKSCGDDGCGSTCGSCTGGQSCNASGQCTGGTVTCTAISVTGSLVSDASAPYNYRIENVSPALGGADLDVFFAQFFAEDTGVIDLASAGVNDNYATCMQCLQVYEDQTADGIGKTYFQSEGTMTIDGASQPTNGQVSFTLSGVTLIEVTVDNANNFTSTPVPGGGCLTVSGNFATVPCVPDCTGRVCGDDGCGGSCGDCGAGQACNGLGVCQSDSELICLTPAASTPEGGCTGQTTDPCICAGCVADGACGFDEDCVCPDCVDDVDWCADATKCQDNGTCDPYNEGCVCADCATHPSCPAP